MFEITVNPTLEIPDRWFLVPIVIKRDGCTDTETVWSKVSAADAEDRAQQRSAAIRLEYEQQSHVIPPRGWVPSGPQTASEYFDGLKPLNLRTDPT